MKIIKLICSSAMALIFMSCGSNQKQGNFNLLPHPQAFEIIGTSKISGNDFDGVINFNNISLQEISLGEISLSKGKKLILAKGELPDITSEGYKLEIAVNSIKLTGKDDAGLFYGLKTLGQLLEDARDQEVNLPQCKIKDYPALAYRAIHLDIKHHMEKLEYYYSLTDWLAGQKINAIIAEVEDKIGFKRQPLVASPDAISIEDWIKLSNYAADRNIEISPLVQGLGHASFILKHDKYESLRDDPDSDWAFNPLDPKTYEVQFDLYLDAMEATPNGKYLHIGGDEVHTTGRNSGKSSLELQLLWLDKVCKFAEEHNRIPIFWDDMPLKHAGLYQPMFSKSFTDEAVDSLWEANEHKLSEFLEVFPKNCIYMRWNYSSPENYGNSKAMEWFMQNGMKVMGATAGQTRWVLMPQKESNFDAIRSFAVSSIDKNLNGLLLTLWDDDSPHFELYKRGISGFSEYTWTGDKRTKDEIKASFRHRHFASSLSDEEYSFIDALEVPVAFWKNVLLRGNQRNYIAGSDDPINKIVIDLPDMENKGIWTDMHEARLGEAEKHLHECEIIAAKINEMKPEATRNAYTLEVYEQVNELVMYSLRAIILLKDLDLTQDDNAQTAAMKALEEHKNKFTPMREKFESVYGKTRILTKPDDYILDQDHHVHLANQSKSFDWQFLAEIYFLKKVEQELLN